MMQNIRNFRHFAIIDLGSAAIRFELFGIKLDGNIPELKLLEKKRTLLRLGQLENSRISDHKIIDLLEILKEIRNLSCHYQDLEIAFVATEALRIAENREEIIDACHSIIPKKIDIISPEKEAQLTIEGITCFENFNFKKSYFLDIGGKSSELSLVVNDDITWSVSIPCGALMLHSNKENKNKPIYLPEEVRTSLNKLSMEETNIPLVGSGGTFRAFDKMLTNFNIQSTQSTTRYMEAFCILEKCSKEEFIKITEDQAERRDLIPQGLGILREILFLTNPSEILVTKFSLRHGLLKSLITPYYPQISQQGLSGWKVQWN